MAQADYVVANAPGAIVRADLNDQLTAIVTWNSGAVEPTAKFPYMIWVDTTAGKIKQRNGANDAWIEIGDAGVLNWGLNLSEFPSGTRMLFDQDSAPTGWTRDVSLNDRLVMVVSGARAHGGSWTISGLSGGGHVHGMNAHVHTTPNHQHLVPMGEVDSTHVRLITSAGWTHGSAIVSVAAGGAIDLGPQNQTVLPFKSSAANGGDTGPASGNTESQTVSVASDASWRPLKRDVILAVKD